MAIVTLKTIFHRNNSQIAIDFVYDETLKNYIKEFEGILWSQTHKMFYIKKSSDNQRNLIQYLIKKHYYVDYKGLQLSISNKANKPLKKVPVALGQLSQLHHELLQSYKNYLLQKRYSPNTVLNYCSVLTIFFRFFATTDVHKITEKDIIAFNQDYILRQDYSRTFQNQIVSALKLFYSHHHKLNLDVTLIERPKKDKRLPEILSLEEVQSLLRTVKNIKHKTLLSLVYACGLRIGEALSLKIDAIDGKRGFIHIKHAKGAKDRYVPLSTKTLEMLRNYYKLYKPQIYLFEGMYGDMYSQGSCRNIMKDALAQTTIKKHVTLHTLRHSYATHLLESGTDLRYIQDILGHSSPKTTMIYTHVSQSNLKNIKNPFDDMDL